MTTHPGRIRAPTRVGDPLRATKAVNRVVAGTGQLAFRGVMWESDVPDGCGPRWEEGIPGLHVGKKGHG